MQCTGYGSLKRIINHTDDARHSIDSGKKPLPMSSQT